MCRVACAGLRVQVRLPWLNPNTGGVQVDKLILAKDYEQAERLAVGHLISRLITLHSSLSIVVTLVSHPSSLSLPLFQPLMDKPEADRATTLSNVRRLHAAALFTQRHYSQYAACLHATTSCMLAC